MSRQQSVRHPSRQHIRPSQDASEANKVPAKPRRSTSLQAEFLLQRYTPLLWFTMLAIVIGSATAAVMSIMDPDASVQYGVTLAKTDLLQQPSVVQTPLVNSNSVPAPEMAPPQTQTNQPATKDQRSDAASPLSAGGVILLSCAAGCFLLSQWLKPEPSPNASRRSRSTRRPDLAQSPHPLHLPQAAPAPDLLTETQAQRLLPATQPSFVISQAQPSQQENASAAEVSVVPVGQSHPLDWDEPSLADSLDLRQRRPLSYWLH